MIFILATAANIYCQQNQRIGEWRSHLPQQFGRKISQSPDKIFYANLWNIISINKEDLSVDFISKVDGLSDIGISELAYDHFNEQLFVIYSNSNIDIITSDQIVNIPNISSNTNLAGDKSINQVFFLDNKQTFFSTAFGIVAFDPSTYNFGNTTFTSVKVNEVSAHMDQLYAATDEGAYTVSLNSEVNIGDFNQWTLLDDANGLPSLYEAKSITSYSGHIYIAENNNLYKSANGVDFQKIFQTSDPLLKIEFLRATSDRLIVGTKDAAFNSEVLFFDADDQFIVEGPSCTDLVNDALMDDQGRIWYADDFNEIRFAEDYTSMCKRISYNSPFSHQGQ